MKINEMQRDEENIRLFIFLLREKGLNVSRFRLVKKNLYVLKTNDGYKVIKGFLSKRSLLFQIDFATKLSQRSEEQTYRFEAFPTGEYYVHFNGYYWVLMPFIKGDKVDFTEHCDQVDAFNAMQQFHNWSIGIKMKETTPIRRLLPYYKFRFQNFQQMQEYIPKNSLMFEHICGWGTYALTKLSEERLTEMEEQAFNELQWIHGDVAHHNFIRTDENKTVLIDFDLVSIGPKEYDYIQLAQRILCSNYWNVDELFTNIPSMKKLSEQKWFLYAIIFPNDIVREWNYLFRRKAWFQFDSLLNYTEKQFTVRLPFIKELMHMLN